MKKTKNEYYSIPVQPWIAPLMKDPFPLTIKVKYNGAKGFKELEMLKGAYKQIGKRIKQLEKLC